MSNQIPAPNQLRVMPEGVNPQEVQCLRFSLDPSAIGQAENGKIPVSGLANNGKPSWHWYWGNFALDLSGGTAKPKTWFLWDHDRNKQIGLLTVEFTSQGIMVSGHADEKLLETVEDGPRIKHMLDEKYPIELSVKFDNFFDPGGEVEVLEANQTAMVNGYEIKGPGHIFRKYVIREVSATTLGHDYETSVARLAAMNHEGGGMANATAPAPAAEKPNDGAQELSALKAENQQLAQRTQELEKQLAAMALETKKNQLAALATDFGIEIGEAEKKVLLNASPEILAVVKTLGAAIKAKQPELPSILTEGDTWEEPKDGEHVSELSAAVDALTGGK